MWNLGTMKKAIIALLGCISIEAAQNQEGVQQRKDALPVQSFDHANDAYMEGYIQALIDMNYYEYKVIVTVRGHTVYLANLPNNALLSNSIISFVKDLPEVESVEVRKELTQDEVSKRERAAEQPQISGIWFPQSTIIFPPLIADPRQPINSVNYRWNDKVVGKSAVAVSIGDDFPIFRWRNVFHWQGDLQIGIEAGIWAVFNFTDSGCTEIGDWCEMVNTDYFVGIPLSYAYDKWSWRMRIYHISSHLGDEFIVDHPDFVCCGRRKNPSFEAIDLFASFQASQGIRLYGGPGIVFHSDSSFHMKPFYLQYGGEFRFGGRKYYYHKLYGTFYVAMNFENWEERNWSLDSTVQTGYEWSKLQGVGRKCRIYISYHSGFSYEGQFFNKRVNYGQVGFSWGF